MTELSKMSVGETHRTPAPADPLGLSAVIFPLVCFLRPLRLCACGSLGCGGRCGGAAICVCICAVGFAEFRTRTRPRKCSFYECNGISVDLFSIFL